MYALDLHTSCEETAVGWLTSSSQCLIVSASIANLASRAPDFVFECVCCGTSFSTSACSALKYASVLWIGDDSCESALYNSTPNVVQRETISFSLQVEKCIRKIKFHLQKEHLVCNQREHIRTGRFSSQMYIRSKV